MSDYFQQIVELLLPEGLLAYFEITAVSTAKEGLVHIHVEEHNTPPDEYKGHILHSKGFLPGIEVQDFPLRGKKCYLHIKRRRWQKQDDIAEIVQRDW